MNTTLLLVLYGLSISFSVWIIFAHRKYFKNRFKAGVVSAFMLAMLFFLVAYTVKMSVAFWIRLTDVPGVGSNPSLEAMQNWFWTGAQCLTTLGLGILAYLTFRKRYDLFIYLRRADKKAEARKEGDSGAKEQ
ncbi:hypothetical protein ACE6ED_13440 [Paenibacillus sp. CN-4]|uniref:hypothetical protein n=1 Tax=Paenibacillus nanchangensis TaxID=3348343 RepID=UPI0039780A9C